MNEEERSVDELTGKVLGHFEIQEEIGRGGMASVYRARQQSMGRTVAIKVLPRSLMHDPTFYERFEREVDVISRLEHPHILPIYDYGQSDGMPYIAMRYLGGGSLEQRLEHGVLDPDELEKPLRQIAQALDHAHRQGIIHRDLKPGNIMLDDEENAYLSDFGIARVLGSNLTGSMIVGTPAYMSPEQANGLPVDGRADIYSLGVMLFHLLTGQRPFQAETPMAVLLKHINEPMPALSEFRADLPAALNNVIDKATAKDPDGRYSSAIEFSEAYSAALRGVAVETDKMTRPVMEVATAALPTDVSPTPSEAVREAATDLIRAPERRGPSRVMILGGLLAIVIVVVGAVVVMMTQGEDDTGTVSGVGVVPTPFSRSSTITQNLYTISMLNDWIPPQRLYDESQGNVMRHSWYEENNSAYVSLAIVDEDLRGDAAFFRQAVERHVAENYDRMPGLEFIDEAVAEDGTIRRSYWVFQPEEGRQLSNFGRRWENITSGQLDVFYLLRPPYLTIVEMYTSDEEGNTPVLWMQAILDSLRVNVGVASTS